MAKQYGGWYDNPDTGRNQRWWNGTWTDGDEPGGSSSSGSSGRDSGAFKAAYDEVYNRLKGDVEAYTSELQGIVGEDYDKAVKWIETNYKEALGTDDTQRAIFMREVANKLEERVGRIQFDYQTGKFRAEQDKNTALQRLQEDATVLREKYNTDAALAREQQAAGLNQRGILNNTREGAVGLAGRDVARLEEEIGNRMSALDRSINRDTENINLGYNRGMEDLTTGARRAGVDSEQQRSYGLEEAAIAKKRKEAEIKRQQSEALRSLPGLAQAEAFQRFGY